jgi:hypothetical protein
MSRHEHWRRDYRENRYCRYLSQDELDHRIRDIVLNMLCLQPDAKIGLPEFGRQGIQWMVLFTHACEEMALRHGPHPNGFTRNIFHREPFPDFAGELARKAAAVLQKRGISGGRFLIKYGRSNHISALYEHGRFRVQPASYYGKPDHNGAVRDDELALQVSLALKREQIMRVVRNPEEVPAAYAGQRLDFRFEHSSDYWLIV